MPKAVAAALQTAAEETGVVEELGQALVLALPTW